MLGHGAWTVAIATARRQKEWEMRTATQRRVSRAKPKFGMIALGVVVLVMSVAPIASAGEPVDIKLASSTEGRTLKLGDIADDDNLVAVAFQKRNLSYVRWSKNYGSSFAPRRALRAGLRATDPRVAVCDDLVFAVSIWQSDVTRNVGVDYRDVLTGTNGSFSLGAGSLADVACFGEVVAVTYVLDDHLWLAVHEGSCANPCVPEVKLDLGTGNFDSPPRISSDGDGFVAAWVTDGIAVQHFAYDADGGGGSFNITPSPVATLMAGKNVYLPVLGGGGPRVALAYGRDGQTHVRIRDGYGAPFGPRIIVSRFCRNCPEGRSQPESVDVSGGNILVEVLRGGGVPTAYEANAFVTTDNGSHWVKKPGHGGGFQRGVLFVAKYAEVWDAHFYNGFPYPETEQLIGFHVRNL